MNNVSNIRIINLLKTSFTSEKNGELVELCKMTYEVPSEESDNFIGSNIVEQYMKVDNFNKLRPYVRKEVQATYTNKLDLRTRTFKSKISKINNIEL